jgi:hypothetical protein
MYGCVTNTCVKENPCMVLIPSFVSKSTGKYCLMKHCMVTLPFPVLKSKGKYCMADKPSHVSRVSLSYPVEIGLTKKELNSFAISEGELIILLSTSILGMFVLFLFFLFPVISLSKLQIFLGFFACWANLVS